MGQTILAAPRGRCLAVLALVTPLGFYTKFYSGPGSAWVALQLGGFLYVVFWVFAVLASFPRLPRLEASLAVVGATIALEFAQLWHPPLLERIRSTFPGRALFGTTFAWSDIPYYGAGGLAAYAMARVLGCGEPPPRRSS